MPIMVTFRAGNLVLLALLASLAVACSREQQDWRSAEGADTSEAWARFIEQHPDSELVSQARARIAQLAEQRDWQHATSIATADAYREFLGRHPSGKWADEARIRIEAFALGSAPRIEPPTPAEAAALRASPGVRALQLAGAAPPSTPPPAPDNAASQASENASPPERSALDGPAPPLAPGDGADRTRAQRVIAETSAEPPAVPAMIASADEAAPSGYGVQLGAFASEASADREWQRLQGRFGAQLGGLAPRIVTSTTNYGPLYRLQVAAAGEAQARALCDSLKEQAQPCVPVLPR
jgi:SPOR domain